MNGNPTGIVKTDVDIITIYATVYITLVNDHPSIKLLYHNNNGLLSYLLGGSFPSAVFSAGMSDKSLDWPAGLISYTIGSSGTGSWSADVANKKRVTSTMRFETAVNGHIKEIAFSNIARIILPASGIYSGLELSDVPIGTGDGVTDTFDLPSVYVDQTSLEVKKDGTPVAVTAQNKPAIYRLQSVNAGEAGIPYAAAFTPDSKILAVAHYKSPSLTMYEDINGAWIKMPDVTGGVPGVVTTDSGRSVAFSPNGLFMSVGLEGAPYYAMYENIDGVWTRMPAVTGGSPNVAVRSMKFSPDSKILVFGHSYVPCFSMYEDIDGVWTKMPAVTGGYPTNNTWAYANGISFSPDGTILAIAHDDAPYLTMYEDIDGVWTKMANVTGGNPAGKGLSVSFSPDGTILAIAHDGAPCLTMYEDIDGVWTKMSDVLAEIPSGNGLAVSFSANSKFLAVGHRGSPYVTVYEDIDGVWTKMPSIIDAATLSNGAIVEFSPNSLLMVTRGSESPYSRLHTHAPIMTQITFDTPPAEGAVITADYTVNGIHKTDQRVIDISGEIQFGEPT
jgi:WD40 repeat protein